VCVCVRNPPYNARNKLSVNFRGNGRHKGTHETTIRDPQGESLNRESGSQEEERVQRDGERVCVCASIRH